MRPPQDHTDGTRYVPDKPCRRGHYLRWVKGGACVDCSRLKDRERYATTKKEPTTTKPRKDAGWSLLSTAAARQKRTEEVLSKGVVYLLRPTDLEALQLLRDVVRDSAPGPVQDACLEVIRHQLHRINEWNRNAPPPPPSKNASLFR